MTEYSWVVGNTVTPSFAGLVSKGKELSGKLGKKLAAVIVSPELSDRDAAILTAAGSDLIFNLPLDTGDMSCEKVAAISLAKLAKSTSPDYILFESSVFFCNVAPALSALLDCGITADCTELEIDPVGRLLQIRPAFGGKKLAHNINVRGCSIATVRRGVFHAVLTESAEKAEVRLVSPCEVEPVWNLRGILGNDKDRQDLSSSEIIVSGGLGMGSREAFQKLYRLADKLGAAVGASRAAVAAGFAGYEHQVGQTGVSVRPKLYIAFGISGAVQHLSGIAGAEMIIAVNSDPKAPIHEYADFSVISDCNEVIDIMLGEDSIWG